jgi:8-amino-7-oxononanoate synthase
LDARETDLVRQDLRRAPDNTTHAGRLARLRTLAMLAAGGLAQDVAARWRVLRERYTPVRGPRLNGAAPRRSQRFEELTGYTGVQKHRAIAARFNFSDPFYQCHEPSRTPHVVVDGRTMLNFSAYDYLGLNGHPAVSTAAKTAIDQYGTSVSASRIVAGDIILHRELEAALADHYQTEAALTFVSGHATNVSTIAALTEPGDLILYDDLAHNSIIVGAKLSGATALPFRHNDPAHLSRQLERERDRHKNALIIAEGLYSMDGDVADLRALVDLKNRYGAWLMVDEAHALGVLGRTGHGSAEATGVGLAEVDIWMGTLSKALAGCGGYICGSEALIEMLRFRAPGQVYSVGMSPPVAAAALAALNIARSEPQRVERLQANGRVFLSEARRLGLDTATCQGYAVCPIMVGDIVSAGRITDRMLKRGIYVLPIIYPAVPIKGARLRFFLTSEHTSEQIGTALRITAEELAAL